MTGRGKVTRVHERRLKLARIIVQPVFVDEDDPTRATTPSEPTVVTAEEAPYLVESFSKVFRDRIDQRKGRE